MAKHQIISREAREYVIGQLHDNGEMAKSEIKELLRPHCSFDLTALREQALDRLVGSIVRGVRDEGGARTAFIVRGSDAVIDIETCKNLSKVSVVEGQLAKQLAGIAASHKKAERRKVELMGQMSLFQAEGR